MIGSGVVTRDVGQERRTVHDKKPRGNWRGRKGFVMKRSGVEEGFS